MRKYYLFGILTLIIVLFFTGCVAPNAGSGYSGRRSQNRGDSVLDAALEKDALTNEDREYLRSIYNGNIIQFMDIYLPLLGARFENQKINELNRKYEEYHIVEIMNLLQKQLDGNFEYLLIITPDNPTTQGDPMGMIRIKNMYERVGYDKNVEMMIKKIYGTLQEYNLANNNISNMYTILSQYQSIIFNTIQGSYYSLSPIKNELNMTFIRYYTQAKLDIESGQTKPEAKSTGSGFFVSTEYIVTCSHVLENAKTISVIVNKESYTATKVADNPSLDIAILKIAGYESRKYFTISNFANETTGDKIYVLGFPLSNILGSEIRVTDGIISARSGLNADPTTFQISAPIQPGNSGGPVINERFNVVGIASHKISDRYVMQNAGVIPQNVNFGVKSDYIIPLLSEFNLANKSTVQSLDDGMQATVYIIIND